MIEVLDLNKKLSMPEEKDIIVVKIRPLGACNLRDKKVILNYVLATNPKFKYLRDKTVFHEWKHVAIFEKYGYSLFKHFINDISDTIKFFTDPKYLVLYFSPKLAFTPKEKKLRDVEEKRPFLFEFGFFLYNTFLIAPLSMLLAFFTLLVKSQKVVSAWRDEK